MNPREHIQAAPAHRPVDRVPVDPGGRGGAASWRPSTPRSGFSHDLHQNEAKPCP